MLGGVAVAVSCADVHRQHPQLKRRINDIDLAGYARQRGHVEDLLQAEGFEPAVEFNYLAAGRRLLYYRLEDRVKVDVFLDEFRMCHAFGLKGRLKSAGVSLDLSDLFLTKAQVVEPARRDIQDGLSVLLAGREGTAESGMQEICDRLRAVCCVNWGWYETASGFLQRLRAEADHFLCGSESGVQNAIDRLIAAI
ncbi:MAG: hypothetical protein KAX19_12125, partial [Candidatus Brocadiae bacterium]|nr:hypothetical protein [Candidatus Brocadiia bacterium]